MPAVQIAAPLPFIGPQALEKVKVRDQYIHRMNETCSLLDRIFNDQILATDPAEVLRLQDPAYLVEQYEEAIREHLERRVAIFFQQLVVCYKTCLHFEIGPTLNQGESAPSLHVQHGTKDILLCKRNAAHSSTIPCLTAYYDSEWQAHKEGKTPKPQGFTYLKGSNFYRLSNATIDMPRDINEADIQIDGNQVTAILRTQSLDLLNQAAKGGVTPSNGIKTFLENLLAVVIDKKVTCHKPGVKKALELYEKHLKEIKETLEADVTVLDRFLDVRVDDTLEASQIRSKIHHIRYKAIQTNLLEQTKIAQKIEGIKQGIFKQLARKPTYFEEAFRSLLIQQMPTEEDKKRIKKFLCAPSDHYDLRLIPSRIKLLENTKSKILPSLPAIQTLAREISHDMYHMRVNEVQQRASTLQQLRHAKHWRQVDLSKEIKKLYAHLPSSQPTISRLETGVKVVDHDFAEKLSRVLKVDPGLFMPQFFNE